MGAADAMLLGYRAVGVAGALVVLGADKFILDAARVSECESGGRLGIPAAEPKGSLDRARGNSPLVLRFVKCWEKAAVP